MAIGSLCRRHSAVLLALLSRWRLPRRGGAEMTEWLAAACEKVSDKSVAWLKKGLVADNGAFQPPWSGRAR